MRALLKTSSILKAKAITGQENDHSKGCVLTGVFVWPLSEFGCRGLCEPAGLSNPGDSSSHVIEPERKT